MTISKISNIDPIIPIKKHYILATQVVKKQFREKEEEGGESKMLSISRLQERPTKGNKRPKRKKKDR